jgi:class 3 adenylate cyclase
VTGKPTQQTADTTLDDARGAFDRHAWGEAYEDLEAADGAAPLGPDDLERLGTAAWWTGRLSDVISAFERAHAGYVAEARPADAARMAVRLAVEYGHRGQSAISGGWLRRAERLVAGQPESVAHAWVSRAHFNDALHRAEYDAALENARATYAIGERLGNADFMALGLHDQGQALVAKGEVDEGLGLIDEATAAAVSGELGPHTTAVVYCNTINACRNLADYGRAGEWTEAAKRWCERQSIAGFPGMCRVQRAEIIRLRGAWPEAEQQARLAASELRDFYLDYAAEGLYQLGEIRLRTGDVEGAADYFGQAADGGHAAQPGLALLRLAEGRPEVGAAMLREALENLDADRLGRARLLPAQVELALALGDRETARRAAAELGEIGETFRTPALLAWAAWAEGSRLLGEGDHAGAIAQARRARKLWQDVDVPYEVARSRVLLGLALRAAGEDEPAKLELEAALTAFDRLGAAPDSSAVRQMLGRAVPTATAIQHIEATFMFTDVVGSTQLVEAIGDEAWENLLRWHDETLTRLFAEQGGDVVKHTGDGFLVVFDKADDAVAAAQAVQRTLAAHRRDHGFAPQVRIGIHSAGSVRHGRDFSGAGVHVAARIGALASEGEILASATTLAASAQRYESADRGQTKLKGIAQPVSLAAVEWR